MSPSSTPHSIFGDLSSQDVAPPILFALQNSVLSVAMFDTSFKIIWNNENFSQRYSDSTLAITGLDLFKLAPLLKIYKPYYVKVQEGQCVEFEVGFPPTGPKRNACHHYHTLWPVFDKTSKVAAILEISWLIPQISQPHAPQDMSLQQLRQKNRDLKQFAYVVSHDLKAPLRVIEGFSELLQMQLDHHISEEAKDSLKSITLGVEHMRSLLDDLLVYTRLEKPVPYAQIDLTQAAEEAKYNLLQECTTTQATISISSLPKVWGNQSQLVTVFQNLFSNALKFRSEKPPKIDVYTNSQEESYFVETSVTDNGIGIDRSNHIRIFDVFQRLHREDQYPGTGIGLALVKRTVEQHHGYIEISSEIGQGTTFRIYLPKDAPNID